MKTPEKILLKYTPANEDAPNKLTIEGAESRLVAEQKVELFREVVGNSVVILGSDDMNLTKARRIASILNTLASVPANEVPVEILEVDPFLNNTYIYDSETGLAIDTEKLEVATFNLDHDGDTECLKACLQTGSTTMAYQIQTSGEQRGTEHTSYGVMHGGQYIPRVTVINENHPARAS